jgi:hypothetical protein
MVSNMKMQRSFPTFDGAHTLLLPEEIDLNDITDDGTPATPPALVAAPTPPQQRPPAPATAGFGAPARSRNSCRRGRGGKSSGSSGGPRQSGGAPSGLGTGHTNPWSGTVQLWPHGYGGLLGHMLRPLPSLRSTCCPTTRRRPQGSHHHLQASCTEAWLPRSPRLQRPHRVHHCYLRHGTPCLVDLGSRRHSSTTSTRCP